MEIELDEMVTGFRFLSKNPDTFSWDYRKTLRDGVICDLKITFHCSNSYFSVQFQINEVVKNHNKQYALCLLEPMQYNEIKYITNGCILKFYSSYTKEFEKYSPSK